MTVATEAAHAELLWTGAETQFSPGFSAIDPTYVNVQFQSFDGTVTNLVLGVHFSVTLAADGAVTVLPLALPAATTDAPATLMIDRDTTATQGVDFVNLNAYDPSVHEGIADRLTMIAAELKGRVKRFLLPFINVAGAIDFRPYRLSAADPLADQDVATRAWVLLVTGVADLQSYVEQAAASASAAAASALQAMGFLSTTEAARDMAQAWSDTPENSNVPGTMEFSAFHWSQKAQAAAATILPYLTETDDGIFGDPDTGSIDDGVFT